MQQVFFFLFFSGRTNLISINVGRSKYKFYIGCWLLAVGADLDNPVMRGKDFKVMSCNLCNKCNASSLNLNFTLSVSWSLPAK